VTEAGLSARVPPALEREGLLLSPVQTQQIIAYIALLDRWNRSMSLASLADPAAAIDRLVLEPLIAAAAVEGVRTVTDVGSGAGSPAVLLKVALPGLVVEMVEVRTRKAAFLREVVRELGLRNTVVRETRAELVEGAADAVTVRAVRLDTRMLETLARLVHPEGRVLIFGTRSQEAIAGGRLLVCGSRPLLERNGSVLMELKRRP
jgi:16S rRNA (guanine527-N7)-methyltransferase